MSKKRGQAANKAVIHDFFGNRNPGKFSLKPPSGFEFFNSLRLVDVDRFAGVTVALLESVFWQVSGKRVSSLTIGAETLYSGSNPGQLPVEAGSEEVEQWLIVASYALDTRDEHVRATVQALFELGCTLESEQNEPLFMFMRAVEALNFNPSLSAEAEENIAHQADAAGYQGTAVSELFPYYERFVAFQVSKNSKLAGCSIFWYSYMVAAHWRGSVARHVNAQALFFISKIYEENLQHFPIDNARLAIAAPHFKHTFIDLYRCIEGLYSLPRCMLVKEELRLPQKATLLAKTLRDKLAWRRTEKDSLELLLLAAEPEKLDMNSVDSCLLEQLHPLPPNGPLPQLPVGTHREARPATLDDWRAYAAKKIASRIYAVRNQFVHQLDDLDKEEVKEGTEAPFIALLAQICAVLYSKYAAEF